MSAVSSSSCGDRREINEHWWILTEVSVYIQYSKASVIYLAGFDILLKKF
jgi:hypothetical protein